MIITTGNFSREAKREASRDGAPPIDLMDGNDLAEKLKELKLGIEIELVEKGAIKTDTDWHKNIQSEKAVNTLTFNELTKYHNNP